ncbi:hypothetical protein GMLC_01300 [Geomonas limicola]|uniref:Aminoglycoside phosphotransferase domain-containing protein n=1 Tax=Geomonas limicola TaxID=2740186 RepID=A0A6V8N2B8_9BACT|nr:phosphotransferase [Geomonas limicola]GFO66551.1 hypothetical protein GMLC_01300 [Geomonas limicola]
MIHDPAVLLDDVSQRLKTELGVELTGSNLLDRRYFSHIYELLGTSAEGEKRYVLKLSTTERSCQGEYRMYLELNRLGVRTLTPVLFSGSHNYLVTVKEELRDLPEVLRSVGSIEEISGYFFRLGRFLKDVEEKTRREAHFDKEAFDAYLAPRIQQMASVTQRDKDLLWRRTAALTATLDHKPELHCLVSDYNLGNLHLDAEQQFVLLDLGDAYNGSSCSNLAAVYLSLKFGPLQQYLEKRQLTARYFSAFLEGFGTAAPGQPEFLVYLIRDLVCMILFVEQHPSGSNNPVRRLMSRASNHYQAARYWSYLRSLTEDV